MPSPTECDPQKEFKCKSGSCIQRNFVNNQKNNCLDGSDEMVENFTCFQSEFKCLSYTQSEEFLDNTNEIKKYFYKCMFYKSFKQLKNYCRFDKNENELIKNCTHNSLFLCQDQSRCLPNKFKCDGIIQCIDGSDEIEHCEHPKYFRYLRNN